MLPRLLHRRPRLHQRAVGVPLRRLGIGDALAGSGDGGVFGVVVQEPVRLGGCGRLDGLSCYGAAVEEGAAATGLCGCRGLGGGGCGGGFVAAAEETHGCLGREDLGLIGWGFGRKVAEVKDSCRGKSSCPR